MIVIDQSRTANDPPDGAGRESAGPVPLSVDDGRGLSRGRNAGIALARGEWLLFVDDDVLLAPDWFERMVARRTGPGRAP